MPPRPAPRPAGAPVAGGRVRRALTLLAGLLTGLGLLGAAGCGFDAQTLQPYTPAMGVNADVGEDAVLKVRNLLLVSREPGRGFVSASLISERPDALVGVGGVSIRPDRTEGAVLQGALSAPVELAPGNLVVLTERPLIVLRTPDLRAGGMARVVLRFREAGEVTLLTPVYRNQDELQTLRPSFPPSPGS